MKQLLAVVCWRQCVEGVPLVPPCVADLTLEGTSYRAAIVKWMCGLELWLVVALVAEVTACSWLPVACSGSELWLPVAVAAHNSGSSWL